MLITLTSSRSFFPRQTSYFITRVLATKQTDIYYPFSVYLTIQYDMLSSLHGMKEKVCAPDYDL